MKLHYLFLITTLLFSSPVFAFDFPFFSASCLEGETHRYDGGYDGKNMLDSSGKELIDEWQTEKWGGLEIVWDGGDTIKVGGNQSRYDNMQVIHAGGGVISAILNGPGLMTTNIYSFVIDLKIGQAVYSQVQGVYGQHTIKVRSQNLKCEVMVLP
jgi:hypothetical protein